MYFKPLTVFVAPILEHFEDGAAIAPLAYKVDDNKVEAKRQMMTLRNINKFYSLELISGEIDELTGPKQEGFTDWLHQLETKQQSARANRKLARKSSSLFTFDSWTADKSHSRLWMFGHFVVMS